MADPHKSATFTSDFRQEFEAETERLLRHRFLWFAGLAGSFGVVASIGVVISMILGAPAWRSPEGIVSIGRMVIAGVMLVMTVSLYLGSFVYVWQSRLHMQALLRLTMGVVFLDGTLDILSRAFEVPNSWGLMAFAISHTIASFFLPWSPRQAVVPVVGVVVLNALSRLLIEQNPISAIVWLVVLSPLSGLPGIFICWIRESQRTQQFKLSFLQRRYGEMRRELVDARRIHEALFPPQLLDGPIHFTYRYEPMRQIGGDYLHAHIDGGEADASLSLAVVDVTGHGIPAALTVNRLHGELQRVFAENPGITPGQVLRLLNRYVHLTLAKHSVYVTAVCFRIDAGRSEIRYASGGHPPAFLRAVDGTIEELESTAFVLGACAHDDFDSGERTLRFGIGDSLIAYTDGATEARDKSGRMLGIGGLRRIVAGPRPKAPGEWPLQVLGAVEQFRFGGPADDTLVIEIYRPLASDQVRRTTGKTGIFSAARA